MIKTVATRLISPAVTWGSLSKTPSLKAPLSPILSQRLSRFAFSSSPDQKPEQIKVSPTYEEMKARQVLAKNVGMNRFLQRIYNTTGLSLMGALGTAFLCMNSPLVLANMGMTSIVGIVMTLGGLIGASYMKPTNVVEKEMGVEILKTTNSPARLGLYAMGIAGLGLSSTPLFMIAQSVSPTIIPTALGITTAIFGGASLVAYSMPKDKMLGMGGVLMGSLFGLIGLQLVGLLSAMFMGPNPLSSLLFSANNYLGIGLFSALIAYDTHVAMKMYEMREADHIGMATQFLLDFWNILTRIISIMSNRD